MYVNQFLTDWQESAIAFVRRHRGLGFATPQDDGGLFLYAYGVNEDGSADIVRDYVPARDSQTLRQLMGY